MFESKGQLRYSSVHDDGVWLVLDVDAQIAEYYRSFIPKHIQYFIPRYPPHISIVRKEKPPNMNVWGKYNGEVIPFFYNEYVYIGKIYCWLDAFSTRLEDIREELGLPAHSTITMPPEGFKRNFHVTIANQKEQKKNN